MTGKPIANKGQNCPLFKKDVSKVCHNCTWYIHIRGMHPQTGEEFDHWGCAISLQPLLMIENSKLQRETGAAVESFRNEMVKLSVPVSPPVLIRPQVNRGMLHNPNTNAIETGHEHS